MTMKEWEEEERGYAWGPHDVYLVHPGESGWGEWHELIVEGVPFDVATEAARNAVRANPGMRAEVWDEFNIVVYSTSRRIRLH